MRATIAFAAISAILPLTSATALDVGERDGAISVVEARSADASDSFRPTLHQLFHQRALSDDYRENCTATEKQCGMTCVPSGSDCCTKDTTAISVYACPAGSHCDKKSDTGSGVSAECKRGNAKSAAAGPGAASVAVLGAVALAMLAAVF